MQDFVFKILGRGLFHRFFRGIPGVKDDPAVLINVCLDAFRHLTGETLARRQDLNLRPSGFSHKAPPGLLACGARKSC